MIEFLCLLGVSFIYSIFKEFNKKSISRNSCGEFWLSLNKYSALFVVILQLLQNIILGLLTGIIFLQLKESGPNVLIDR